MKKKVSKKKETQSAEAQNRCIWMTAGVISFKLCPFDYDCEHCDLDKAMRSEVKLRKIRPQVKRHKPETFAPEQRALVSERESKEAPLFFTFSVGELGEGLYLHPVHLWARQIEGKKWRVGIDQLLAYVLPSPTRVRFYDLDKDLSQDQVFGEIVTEPGTVFLSLPLSGHPIQTNPNLLQDPELVQKDPYGEGWLLTLEWFGDHSELEKFHAGFEGTRFLGEEALHLKSLLKHRGVGVDQIGDTLRDGGVDIKYLHQLLPAKVCLRLANELIVTGKQTW